MSVGFSLSHPPDRFDFPLFYALIFLPEDGPSGRQSARANHRGRGERILSSKQRVSNLSSQISSFSFSSFGCRSFVGELFRRRRLGRYLSLSSAAAEICVYHVICNEINLTEHGAKRRRKQRSREAKEERFAWSAEVRARRRSFGARYQRISDGEAERKETESGMGRWKCLASRQATDTERKRRITNTQIK